MFGFVFSQVYADSVSDKKDLHHSVVIVGGGAGGLAVAAQLKRKEKDLDIAIIEPSKKHYYQPLWTLVGAGIFKKEESERDESQFIPKGTKWMQTQVTKFSPTENKLTTGDGKTISYDYLVIATGVENWWDKLPGSKAAVGKNNVSSNYSYEHVDKTWEFGKNLKQGQAIFTVPDTPVKCGGAPQKVMWLFDDYWRKQGVRDKIEITFVLPQPTMFSVKKYSDTLDRLRKERNISAKFQHSVLEIKGDKNEIVLKNNTNGEISSMRYDFLHVVPPMGPSQVIRESGMTAPNGYIDVDKHTLQHTKFSNVFSLGDVANLPTSKTVAALTQQAPTVVCNLRSVMKKEAPTAKYNGYTSCPITLGNGKLLLAEFAYDGEVKETFKAMDQAVPRSSLYYLKTKVFPQAYWSLYLRGYWYGPNLFWSPF